MTPAQPTNNEVQRLHLLHDLGILDTGREDRFERIVRVAAYISACPIVAISLVDEHRQWFKAKRGLAVNQTGRSESICGHAIHQLEPLVVSDTYLDERFADNPLVTGPPFIRFYAGFPFSLDNEHILGTLCVIDRQPRELDGPCQRALADLAHIVEHELTMTQQNVLDPLTGLLNRRGFKREISEYLNDDLVIEDRYTLLHFDVRQLHQLNHDYGKLAGDQILKTFARCLNDVFDDVGWIGRIEGCEFAALLIQQDADAVDNQLEQLYSRLSQQLSSYRYPFSYTAGLAHFSAVDHTVTLDTMLLDASNEVRHYPLPRER
ncbi:GGDEF domain-containing protein [Salinivibrio proteolyticus]|uniref:Sensor domain-containing diguanylate cyclase n=1 Tax=Salinivibrio proteolyticus TaxID=334715 RepID=A0ABY7LBE8_9GAMM|nr:sensor domain-containing diguanylate cyclase [Salinivibrio proteolyticus]WBA13814.1 sensor domain-containing diguanylate cyclase [Salinivibrio proteolyticus]